MIEIAGAVEVQRGHLDDHDDEADELSEPSGEDSSIDSLKSRLNAAFYQRHSSKSEMMSELIKLTKLTAKSLASSWTSNVAISTNKVDFDDSYSDKQKKALDNVIDTFQVVMISILRF